MRQSVLDTDIVSEIHRAKNSIVASNASEYLRQHAQYTLSAMTVTEMVKGWHKLEDERRTGMVLTFFDLHTILPIRREEAEVAGRIIGSLERRGIPIGAIDPIIAATALVHNLPLVTGNLSHFSRITELGYPLELVNWRDPQPRG